LHMGLLASQEPFQVGKNRTGVGEGAVWWWEIWRCCPLKRDEGVMCPRIGQPLEVGKSQGRTPLRASRKTAQLTSGQSDWFLTYDFQNFQNKIVLFKASKCVVIPYSSLTSPLNN
jgi:hypothetical protein